MCHVSNTECMQGGGRSTEKATTPKSPPGHQGVLRGSLYCIKQTPPGTIRGPGAPQQSLRLAGTDMETQGIVLTRACHYQTFISSCQTPFSSAAVITPSAGSYCRGYFVKWRNKNTVQLSEIIPRSCVVDFGRFLLHFLQLSFFGLFFLFFYLGWFGGMIWLKFMRGYVHIHILIYDKLQPGYVDTVDTTVYYICL